MKNTATYSSVQIGLHWLVAILALAAWIAGDGMSRLLRQRIEGTGDTAWPLHVWLGLAVLAVVLVRWIVRLSSGDPGPVPGATETEARLRHWGHLGLYLLLLMVPVGGAAAWFLKIDAIAGIHSLAGDILIYGAGAHALIALWHQYWRKDGTLTRMLRPS